MKPKEILFAVLGVILPILVGQFLLKNPDFPLDVEQIVSTLLYIIGALFGGWQLCKGRLKAKGVIM